MHSTNFMTCQRELNIWKKKLVRWPCIHMYSKRIKDFECEMFVFEYVGFENVGFEDQHRFKNHLLNTWLTIDTDIVHEIEEKRCVRSEFQRMWDVRIFKDEFESKHFMFLDFIWFVCRIALQIWPISFMRFDGWDFHRFIYTFSATKSHFTVSVCQWMVPKVTVIWNVIKPCIEVKSVFNIFVRYIIFALDNEIQQMRYGLKVKEKWTNRAICGY